MSLLAMTICLIRPRQWHRTTRPKWDQVSVGSKLMRSWIIAICLLATTVATVYADSRSIHVEWGYTPPTEPAVTGFRLYQEGTAVHNWEGASTIAGDATVDLTTRYTSFTLTAMFTDNTESPHSAPFLFDQYLSTGVVITWNSWIWFAKPGRKHMRIDPQTLTGARLR